MAQGTLYSGLHRRPCPRQHPEYLQKFLDFGITTGLSRWVPRGDVNPLRAASNDPASGLPTYRPAGPVAAAPGSHHARMLT